MPNLFDLMKRLRKLSQEYDIEFSSQENPLNTAYKSYKNNYNLLDLMKRTMESVDQDKMTRGNFKILSRFVQETGDDVYEILDNEDLVKRLFQLKSEPMPFFSTTYSSSGKTYDYYRDSYFSEQNTGFVYGYHSTKTPGEFIFEYNISYAPDANLSLKLHRALRVIASYKFPKDEKVELHFSSLENCRLLRKEKDGNVIYFEPLSSSVVQKPKNIEVHTIAKSFAIELDKAVILGEKKAKLSIHIKTESRTQKAQFTFHGKVCSLLELK